MLSIIPSNRILKCMEDVKLIKKKGKMLKR